jgi:hypothetical protein
VAPGFGPGGDGFRGPGEGPQPPPGGFADRGRFGPRGGFGGPPPGGPGGPALAGALGTDFALLIQAQADLRAALDDPRAAPDSIREKVAALRQARQKARAALDAASKDLVELLTPDQEAVLVSMGYLD